MGWIVNKRELSEILGKSEQAISDWQKQGLPIAEKGAPGKPNKYDTSVTFEFIRKLDSQKNITEYEIERTRLTKNQADFKALEVKQLEGELMPVDIVVDTWQALIAAARVRILSIPSSVKTQIPHTDVETIDLIADICRETLTELSTDGIPDDLRQRVAKHVINMETATESDAE